MNISGNQLHMETERKLRDALLFFMKQEKEPTVGELCRKAQINRSTFYRHYTDVYDLMNRVEQEFRHGLYRSLDGDSSFLAHLGSSPEALEPLIAYIGRNPHFYRVYLQKYAANTGDPGFQRYWQNQVLPLFQSCGVHNEAHIRYYYEYVKAGIVSILRLWLENGCPETPAELAQILCRMLPERTCPA